MKYAKYNIIRCKWLLKIQDGPSHNYIAVVQGVGGHVDMDTKMDRYLYDTLDSSKLVVIFQYAVSEEIAEKIRKGFEDCGYTAVEEARRKKSPAEKMMAAAYM